MPILKHADAQTVSALAAVFQAIHHYGLSETDITQWGVLAAYTYLGRAALADNLQRLAVEGAWGISPHFIPHHSLHAISGTISQALKIHGPNLGIEANPTGIAEALTVAATFLANDALPGLWLVLTAYEPELIPEDPELHVAGKVTMPPCVALALALVPDIDRGHLFMLRLCPQGNHENQNDHASWMSWTPLVKVSALADALERRLANRHWRLGCHGWAELSTGFCGVENGS
jgi:hypothetical protein